jgi:hypothetical protein
MFDEVGDGGVDDGLDCTELLELPDVDELLDGRVPVAFALLKVPFEFD